MPDHYHHPNPGSSGDHPKWQLFLGLKRPILAYIPKQNISGPGTCGKSEFQFPVELTAEVIWHIWHFESSDPCSLNIGSVWNRCDFNKCHYSSQQRIFQCLSQLFSPLHRTLFSQCAWLPTCWRSDLFSDLMMTGKQCPVPRVFKV